MRDKIEVWPKMVALGIMMGIPFIFSDKDEFTILWFIIILLLMQIHILLVNDERIFDIHKRLYELEKREESNS